MGQRAAKRYAHALIDLAKEQGSMDKIYEQTQNIAKCLTQSSDLRSVLNSPVIQNEDKVSIAKEVFKSYDPMLTNLFDALADNHRLDHLRLICNAYANMYNAEHNIQEAHITSAVELDKKDIKAFRDKIKKMTGSEAQITTEVNEELIGGFILQLNDLQYDASISGKLNKIKRNFNN